MLFSESFLVADIIEREASLNKMKSSIELLFYWCGRGLNMYCLYTLYVCINSRYPITDFVLYTLVLSFNIFLFCMFLFMGWGGFGGRVCLFV